MTCLLRLAVVGSREGGREVDAFHDQMMDFSHKWPVMQRTRRKCSVRRPAERDLETGAAAFQKSNGWGGNAGRGGRRRLQSPVLLAVCLDPRVIKLCDPSHITIPRDAVEAFEPAGSDFPFPAGPLEPRRGGNDPSPPQGASPIPSRGSHGKTRTRPCQTR